MWANSFFFIVCWGILVGGKGRYLPGKQESSLNVRVWKCIRIGENWLVFKLVVLYHRCVYIFAYVFPWQPFLFVLLLALLHPNSQDVDPPGVAWAAGVDFSRPQLCVILAPSYVVILGSYCLAGIQRLRLPSVINIAAFCHSRPDIVRILLCF